MKVQKFNMNDIEKMNIHFLRNIQPGTIELDGTFKKIAENVKETANYQKKKESEKKIKE
jgi:hypothetical protein